jgi:hypothetical protein
MLMPASARLTLATEATTITSARHIDARIAVRPTSSVDVEISVLMVRLLCNEAAVNRLVRGSH